jgi:phosphatidylglycerophosphatase A
MQPVLDRSGLKFGDLAALRLATGLHVGYLPLAPGTWGTLVGLPFCLLLARLDAAVTVVCLAGVIAGAVWAAGRAERVLGVKDAQCIVIDEMAGILIGLAGIPATLPNLLFGFALFRCIDILKPFPAGRIERRVRGGWGIVLDDVVAGVYCNLLVRGIGLVFGNA